MLHPAPGSEKRLANLDYSASWEPLYSILSEEEERLLRFQLAYKSGWRGGITDVVNTGELPLSFVLWSVDKIKEISQDHFDTYFENLFAGINRMLGGKS